MEECGDHNSERDRRQRQSDAGEEIAHCCTCTAHAGSANTSGRSSCGDMPVMVETLRTWCAGTRFQPCTVEWWMLRCDDSFVKPPAFSMTVFVSMPHCWRNQHSASSEMLGFPAHYFLRANSLWL